MSYDTWKTTEPDEDRYDLRCDNCGHSLTGCVCRREDEPMESVAAHLADALTDVLVHRVKAEKDTSEYFHVLELQHAIEEAQSALRRIRAWAGVA
jgi:hypothetical protein